jgi:prepilin-type N-terminal cleavage/methylation domain-containing protein
MKSGDYRAAYRSTQRGFTLLELLVVIAIIGVLSSIILANLASARSEARDAARATLVREMRNAMELYYSERGEYPTSHDDAGNVETNYNAVGALPGDFDGTLAGTVRETNLSNYYSDEPRDPIAPATEYGYATDGNGYAILLFLEGIDPNGDYCKVRVNAPAGVYGSVSDCVF